MSDSTMRLCHETFDPGCVVCHAIREVQRVRAQRDALVDALCGLINASMSRVEGHGSLEWLESSAKEAATVVGLIKEAQEKEHAV